MRIFCALWAFLLLALFCLPAIALQTDRSLPETVQTGLTRLHPPQAPTPEENGGTVTVRQVAANRTVQTDVLDYLIGVLASEVSPHTPTEALKAQAVAAYTNVLRLKKHPDKTLGGADISDDPAHHQGYWDADTRQEKWGDKTEAYTEKLANAVRAVYGEALAYDGQPIMAAYFARCGGQTEAAETVWGSPVPYLIAVDSKGDADDKGKVQKFSWTASELQEKFAVFSPDFPADAPDCWFQELQATPSGIVRSVLVGGKPMSGQQVRQVLALPSAAFTVQSTETGVTLSVTGAGHFVGMSQTGAAKLAEDGATYREILAHYYPGTTLVSQPIR